MGKHQTERINVATEEYLRGFGKYHQDGRAKFLPPTEFSGNKQVSAATGASPFPAIYSRDPKASFKLDIRTEGARAMHLLR